LLLPLDRDLEATLARDEPGVHQVYRSGHHPSEQPGEGRPGQQLGVALGDGAGYPNVHTLEMAGIELDREDPQPLGECDEGTELHDRRRVADRDVDGVLDQVPVAERDELPGDVHSDVDLRLAGVRAEVRRHDESRMPDEALDRLAGRWFFA